MVRADACEARGPGFDSSSDKIFFFSPRVSAIRNILDPDVTNCVLVRIHVEKNNNNHS